MSKVKPFYVYRILGEMGETLYIGKGTGNRLARQKRRFDAEGEIVASFMTESAAYRHERELIELESPPLNRIPGGTGGVFGCASNMSETALLYRVAQILRRLATMDLKSRRPFERVVFQVASKRGLGRFIEEMDKHNIIVDFVDEIPMSAGT